MTRIVRWFASAFVGLAGWTTPLAENIAPSILKCTPLDVPRSGSSGFTRLPEQRTGIQFTNRISEEKLARNQVLELGAGLALGDVNGDERTDIYICASEGGNRLYLNQGDWRFSDITDKAGVRLRGQASTGAVLADVDGDGDLDLIVNSLDAGTRLFLNNGAAGFHESKSAGLPTNNAGTSLALADINGDGELDLYVANYRRDTVKDQPGGLNDVRAGFVNGEFVITPPGRFLPIYLKSGSVSLFERAEADVLLINNGAAQFSAVAWTNGMFLDENGRALTDEPRDWALSVAFRDINQDGAPDLYVCNDFFFSPDRIWLNDRRGRFQAISPLAVRQTSMSSMAVDFADINRDGWDDFMVLDMLSLSHERRHRQRGSLIHVEANVPVEDPRFRLEVPRNTLSLNRGDGTYAEIGQLSGIDASEWSWGLAFLDVDLDGYEDVLVTTGNLRDANDADVARRNSRSLSSIPASGRDRPPPPRLESPCLAFRNRGDLTFQECGKEWGWATHGISHGMALGDLDGDGDLDVVVNHLDQGLGLYRNESIAPRLAVRLHGQRPNTQGIGARIVISDGAVPEQSQEVVSGGRYLSGDDPLRAFAAGDARRRLRARVTWRSGRTQIFDDLPANSLIEISEAEGTADEPPRIRPQTPVSWFEDISQRLPAGTPADAFDDFATQPLLARKLSHQGPGLSWFDADGDGWDDLILGAGRGGELMLYQNNTHGGFRALKRPDQSIGETTTIIGWRETNAVAHLIVGVAELDPNASAKASAIQFALQGSPTVERLSPTASSSGPLALGVLEDNLALFVGGRVRPGDYPRPASSQVFVREKEHWTRHAAASDSLQDVGLVSGAVWADLDGDGTLELILACDWGSLRVFSWKENRFEERTRQLGLAEYTGWWTSVIAGDFNGDGSLDLVAGNWGRNSKYQRHLSSPIRLYYGDADGDGRSEAIEAYYDQSIGSYVPFQPLDVLRRTAPAMVASFSSFGDYARAGLDQILGERKASMKFCEVTWPDTTLFLNKQNRFEARPLTIEAQFAPVFGLAVSDFDGDGNDDLFLAQNFFGVDQEMSRYDAGRGLLLRGNGKAEFQSLPGQESGIVLYGAQRAAAVSDFDHDGRPDLAVAQHSGPVGLFRNRVRNPGLRVQLTGPPGNREAIGAIVQLESSPGRGPARIRNAGGGYWSQDSSELVLGIPEHTEPTYVYVRWPGGKTSRHPISAGVRVLKLDFPAP